MTVSTDIKSKILRYYHVDKWRVGTIARELGVHHYTVKRILSATGVDKTDIVTSKSIIDDYLPFILETLDKHPKLTASRLYDMVCERGYPGGPDHFRQLISIYRPVKAAEAYLRLKTLPGEQGQVDWGHFDHLTIGQARRPLMAFVMVLSYSRKIYLQFFLNQRMSSFLTGHLGAFEAWGGVPKVLLYDNLKSAVLERQGDAIRFHPTLLEFSGHYRFEPRPVAVARGNEKGRVERAIRYIRDNFFAGRTFKNIDDLNQQAKQWYEGHASTRPCPEDKRITVQTAFEKEQSLLISLPSDHYPVHEREEVSVGKTPYVRFDLNDYSVPYKHVCKKLTLQATMHKVWISDGATVVAEHERSFDKGEQIENPEHIDELIKRKKKARQHRNQDRLSRAAPASVELMQHAAEQGYHMKSMINALLKLLVKYGGSELNQAIKETIAQHSFHSNSVRIMLERRREDKQQLPPINLDLPDDERLREQVVKPHKLDTYDHLSDKNEEPKDE